MKEEEQDQDLPKNWKDSQNHYLHGNKAHHLASLAIWESQHGESWKEEKKKDITHYSVGMIVPSSSLLCVLLIYYIY